VNESRDVERYMAGTLSEAELARFEEEMIAHPELAADVGVRRRIKAGLSRLEQNHELEVLLKEERGRPSYFRYAAAASVLVVVAAGIMTVWKREEPAPLQALFNSSEIGARQVATSFMLATTRSADKPAFEMRRNGGPVALRIVVDDTATAPFTVRLSTGKADSTPIQESSVAEVSDGFAVVYIDPRDLESGDYTLALKSGAGAEQLFPFRLNVLP